MENRNRYLLTLFFLALTIGVFAKVKPENLKCEYLINPEGIDMQAPRFFWKLTSTVDAQYQTAYQILVATSQEKLDLNYGDAFDSKKVLDSDKTYKEGGNPGGNFFYRHMVGINSDPEAPGFQKIIFKSNFIKAMDFTKGSYNSIYGEIKAEWKKVGEGEYKVLVPTNCAARVVLLNLIESGEYIFKVSI